MSLSRLSWETFKGLFPVRFRRRLGNALLSFWNCVYGIAFMLLLPLAILVCLAVVLGLVIFFQRLAG